MKDVDLLELFKECTFNIGSPCKKCPHNNPNISYRCQNNLRRDTYEYAKALKEENERLNKKYENLDKYTDKFANQICELEQENKNLLKQIKQGTGERK